MSDAQTLCGHILRCCLTEAIQLGILVECPDLKPYDRRLVIRMIHACAFTGLVDHWGVTSGKWYRTSRVGWIVLTVLEGESR